MHTDIPTNEEILRLLSARAPGRISIYLPTSPIPAQNDASRAEFKELAGKAIGQVRASNGENEGNDTRKAVAELEEHFSDLYDDRGFWQHLSHSLAVFADEDGLRTYRLPNRLSGFVEVGDRFFVKPLLRTVTFPQTAYVLAIAEKGVRLVKVTADTPAETLDVPDMPENLEAVATTPEDRGRNQLGRILGDEGQTVQRRQYARAVDRAVRRVLTGRSVPLILAAAAPLDSIYRSLNSYPHLVDEVITGNPEGRSDAELADRARPILDDLYAAQISDVRDRFDDLRASGRAASDLSDISRAAVMGAVDTLMFDIDRIVPGTFDDETGEITVVDDNDASVFGVVDEVARRVLMAGGRVLAVRADDLPKCDSQVAAILRYSA